MSSQPFTIIEHRDYLPFMLIALGLLGEGAEIGVCEGVFSDHLLKNWPGKKLYSIDPWTHFDETTGYADINNVQQQEQDSRFHLTSNRLNVYGDRSSIIRKTSKEASLIIPDNSLDFVYIDAQHQFDAVLEDILLWYPKIRSKGVIGGHDYLDGVYVGGVFGVKSAVNKFAQDNDLTVMVSNEPNGVISWFILKP